MIQVAHQAGAYHDFCSMKRLGVLLYYSPWIGLFITGSPTALNLLEALLPWTMLNIACMNYDYKLLKVFHYI